MAETYWATLRAGLFNKTFYTLYEHLDRPAPLEPALRIETYPPDPAAAGRTLIPVVGDRP